MAGKIGLEQQWKKELVPWWQVYKPSVRMAELRKSSSIHGTCFLMAALIVANSVDVIPSFVKLDKISRCSFAGKCNTARAFLVVDLCITGVSFFHGV